jgi:hypothetical protein
VGNFDERQWGISATDINVSARRLLKPEIGHVTETVYIESRVHQTSTGLCAEILDAMTPLTARYLPEG